MLHTVNPDAPDLVDIDPDIRLQAQGVNRWARRLQRAQHGAAVELVKGRSGGSFLRVKVTAACQERAKVVGLASTSFRQRWIGNPLRRISKSVVE